MAHRYTRRARLLKPDEFKTAFASGSRYSDRWLTAVLAPNSLTTPRLGLAVPKKAVALATDRNRFKRLARESFRLNRHRLPSMDIVLTVRSGAVSASNEQIFSMLETLWRRLEIRCKAS